MKYDNYIIRTKDYVGIFKFKSTFNFLKQERIKFHSSMLVQMQKDSYKMTFSALTVSV